MIYFFNIYESNPDIEDKDFYEIMSTTIGMMKFIKKLNDEYISLKPINS